MKLNSRNLTISISGIIVLFLCLMAPLSLLYSVVFSSSVSQFDLFDSKTLSLLLGSLFLYGLVTVLSVIIAVPIAYLLSRVELILRNTLLIVFVSPLFVPSYIHALSWSRMFSEGGVIHHLFFRNPAIENIGFSVSGWSGTIWVLALSYYPIILMAVYFASLRWDRKYYHAAILMGSPKKAFYLELKYLQTPILLSALLVFILSFSDFGVPDLFQIRTYSTELFIQLSAYFDKNRAIAMSFLPMVIFIALLGYISKKISGLAISGTIGPQVILKNLSGWRLFLSYIMWFIVFWMVILPLVNLLYMSRDTGTVVRAFNMITDDLLTSLIISGTVAVTTVLLALFVTYGYVRNTLFARKWIRITVLMMLVLPGSLLSLGLIQVWNRDGWMGWLYQSGIILVLGLVIRWLPVVFELLIPGWMQISRNQENAAYTAGLSWWRTMRVVMIPQLKPALLITLLVSFILTFNEMTMVVLLSPPGLSVLPTRIYSTVHYGPDNLLAAICLIQIAVLYILFGLLIWSIQQHFKKSRGHEIAVA